MSFYKNRKTLTKKTMKIREGINNITRLQDYYKITRFQNGHVAENENTLPFQR